MSRSIIWKATRCTPFTSRGLNLDWRLTNGMQQTALPRRR